MNVVLLVIDSLRADRLSLYGYHRPTSPCMDSLGHAGAWFENFFTVGTPTLPACTSLLTGQFPLTHRVLMRKGGGDLCPRAPWLPEILQAHGYATVAIDNLATRKPWFARGFSDYLNLRVRGDEYLSAFEFNRAARPWIAAHRNQPFFLYMRYGDTHTPYAPPAAYRRLFHAHEPRRRRWTLGELLQSPFRHYMLTQCKPGEWPNPAGDGVVDVDWCRAQYDAEVRAADDGVAELLAHLRQLGLAENTAVVIVGDHGESLGEHDILFDHHGLYECTIRPPLIMHWPGVTTSSPVPLCTQGEGRLPASAGRVSALAQTPDIPATVLDLLAIPRPPTMEGQSLAPLVTGRGAWQPYAQIVACESTWMFKWAWRKAGYKLIVAREPDLYGKPPVELYDLHADPEERINLAAERGDVREAMRREFEGWLAQRLRETGQTEDPVARLGRARRRRLHCRLLRQKIRWMCRCWFEPGRLA